jgi:hypothetical protein
MDVKLNMAGTRRPFNRIAGIGAIGFAAVILLVNALVLVPAGLPSTGSEIRDVVTFFGHQGTAVGIGHAFTPLAWTLSTVFAAGAVAAAWDSERSRGEAWALVGFTGVITQNVAVAVVTAIRLALADVSAATDGGTVAGLWSLHEALFTLNGTFLALALVGLSISGVRSGLIGAWHATLGLAAAALQLTSATITPLVMEHGGLLGLVGLASWLMWVAWLVFYGVALIRLAPGQGASPITAAA